jgi:hypothetical protein
MKSNIEINGCRTFETSNVEKILERNKGRKKLRGGGRIEEEGKDEMRNKDGRIKKDRTLQAI